MLLEFLGPIPRSKRGSSERHLPASTRSDYGIHRNGSVLRDGMDQSVDESRDGTCPSRVVRRPAVGCHGLCRAWQELPRKRASSRDRYHDLGPGMLPLQLAQRRSGLVQLGRTVTAAREIRSEGGMDVHAFTGPLVPG
jgi:hypothetical protein